MPALTGFFFFCSSSILVELKFKVLVFVEEKKTGEPGETPLEQEEIQQQTQPTILHQAPIEPCPHWSVVGDKNS